MNLFQTAAAPEPLSMLTMLGGGLLAFVSPCVLPMLPVYAMYLMGGEKERGSWLMVLRRCLGLLFGFVLLFTLMGAGAGAIGSMLKNALLCSFSYLPRTIVMVLLNAVFPVVVLLLPGVLFNGIFVLLIIWFSGIAYLNTLLLRKTMKQLEEMSNE